MKTDWKGAEITEPELPTDEILVWEISPNPYDSGVDSVVERSYQRAARVAQEAVEHFMDVADAEELKADGISVEIKLVQMQIQDYLECLEQ